MKYTAIILSSILIASCKTTEQNARLGSLVNLAVSVAEARGVITSQDAADIRAAETIVLPTTAAPVTSGK